MTGSHSGPTEAEQKAQDVRRQFADLLAMMRELHVVELAILRESGRLAFAPRVVRGAQDFGQQL